MVDARQLQYILDITAKNRGASEVVKNLNNDLKATGKTADTVSQSLARISRDAKIERIGEQFGKMAVKIRDTDKAAAALEKTLKRIGATDPEIERATGAFARAGGLGDQPQRLSNTLRTLGREGRALPALNIPGAGGLSTDAVSKVVSTLGSLPPVALPVIGVLVALGAGFVALEVSMAGAKKALTDAVNANKAYYELIADGTSTEDAKKRLEELKTTQKAQQDELATITTATSQAFKDAVATFGDAGARLLFGLGNVSTADDALAARQDELTKSIAANTTETEGITRALNNGTLASNDYRKALEEEAKIKSDAALAGANDTYQRQLKLQQEGLMSSSQIMSKITESIQQQNAAQAALNQLQADKARGVGGVDIDKQITEFQLQLGRTGADINRLYQTFADRKAIEDTIQSEKDLAAARKEVDKINDDVNKAAEKFKEELAALDDKLLQAQADLKSAFDNANFEAEIDRQQKLADLATDANDKQVETQEKYNEEKIKIEEDYQNRVKQIEKEFNRSSTEAIQDRDAVALDAAERKRKDELEDAATDRDQKSAEREREYRLELRQLQDNNARRAAEINLDFQRQAEQRARKYAYDQLQLQISNQRELDARRAAYERQLTELRKNLQMNSDLWSSMGQAIIGYVKNVKDSINNILGGGTSAVGNGAVSNVSDLFSFASGGTITKSGLVNVHAGEVILNRKQQKQMGGGFSFAPVINGTSKFEIKRLVNIELDNALNEAGF
jgi:hypothetical protein